MDTTEQVDDFVQNEDGAYVWSYVLNMRKNNHILRVLLIVLGLCALALYGGFIWIGVSNGKSPHEMLNALMVITIIMVIAVVVVLGIYALVVALYGGKYAAIFVMDETSISNYQPREQADKAAMIGRFASVAGSISHNSALRASATTIGSDLVVRYEFDKIMSLTFCPEAEEIKVHALLTWSSVYVPHAHFDFVEKYMSERCVNAKTIHKN